MPKPFWPDTGNLPWRTDTDNHKHQSRLWGQSQPCSVVVESTLTSQCPSKQLGTFANTQVAEQDFLENEKTSIIQT